MDDEEREINAYSLLFEALSKNKVELVTKEVLVETSEAKITYKLSDPDFEFVINYKR